MTGLRISFRFIMSLVLIALLAVITLPTTGVSAAPSLQESHDGSNDSWWTPRGSIWLGQTFTATSNHSVTSVKFNILYINGNPGDIYVYLMATDGSGLPTGSYLATAVRSSHSSGWQEWTFSTPYVVTDEEEYALVISAPSSDDSSNNINLWMENSGTYGDGHSIMSFNSGASWSSSTLDMDFEVYGETASDFGDAPDPTYPTLLVNDGARHVSGTNLYLGSVVDWEADGQPDADAIGDDTNNTDDEDGVTFITPLIPGQTASIDVTSVVPGAAAAVLNAWIDFNIDGDWGDAGEQIFTNQSLTGGTETLNFSVPSGAIIGTTFARFRASTDTDLLPTGLASNGEVEDYEVEIGADFGDAPDPTYPTLLASDGARHSPGTGLYLGSDVDYEADGQPDADATGDDTNNTDDEDGITFTTPLITDQTASIDLTSVIPVGATAVLNAWIDFNIDGDWDDADEQIFDDQSLTGGTESLDFTVPSDATPGTTFARFRISTDIDLLPTGLASNGEVEDYQVEISEPPAPEVPVTVGGEVYPVNKVSLMAPWIALTAVIVAGSIYFRNRHQNC